ncbi:hypothetical protein E3983_10695 [Legionella israelensis]|uniref:Uncharacterized protein n=1 Tax=Legionella israelensis TaxID=454 RepID=A0AAX1EIJ1_9GAMM|nr:hypothetical protein [Legionella israelensis]QBR84780.1 hypothetical protein E3983_10695 [Legionella israelensis]
MSKATISKQEAFQVIEKFNQLNASRAPIAEFVNLIDIENFEIRLQGSNIFFKGIAGLADHQIGKQIFFDQSFDCEFIHSHMENDQMIVETKGVWYAKTWQYPAAYSQQLIADLRHTWRLEKQSDGHLLIVSHVCEHFAYREGYSPTDHTQEFHLLLK